jgi:hypothetical protein
MINGLSYGTTACAMEIEMAENRAGENRKNTSTVSQRDAP